MKEVVIEMNKEVSLTYPFEEYDLQKYLSPPLNPPSIILMSATTV